MSVLVAPRIVMLGCRWRSLTRVGRCAFEESVLSLTGSLPHIHQLLIMANCPSRWCRGIGELPGTIANPNTKGSSIHYTMLSFHGEAHQMIWGDLFRTVTFAPQISQ